MLNVPEAPLKAIFFIHVFFSSWAMLDSWTPVGYLYYCMLFNLLILWGIHNKDTEEPILMALLVNVGAVILDIVVLATHSPGGARFSLVNMVVNMLFRPFACMILIRIFQTRGGRYADYGFPNFAGVPGMNVGSPGGQYDDLDRPQSVPRSGLDTGTPNQNIP